MCGVAIYYEWYRFNPYNWGMIWRSSLFSPKTEITANGTVYLLATFELRNALWGQLIILPVLFLINQLAVRHAKVTERRNMSS